MNLRDEASTGKWNKMQKATTSREREEANDSTTHWQQQM